MKLLTSSRNVVVDASVVVGLCAREPDKYHIVRAVLRKYADAGMCCTRLTWS